MRPTGYREIDRHADPSLSVRRDDCRARRCRVRELRVRIAGQPLSRRGLLGVRFTIRPDDARCAKRAGESCERARESQKPISGYPGTRGSSMSLDAPAFSAWFDRLPFSNGEEGRIACDRQQLADPGRSGFP